MVYTINKKLAEKIGIREALVFEYIYIDILNKAKKGNTLVKGEHWCRISHKMLSVKFPVLSRDVSRHILENLVRGGLLKQDEINTSSFDRTASYTLTEVGKAIIHEVQKVGNTEKKEVFRSKLRSSNFYEIRGVSPSGDKFRKGEANADNWVQALPANLIDAIKTNDLMGFFVSYSDERIDDED